MTGPATAKLLIRMGYGSVDGAFVVKTLNKTESADPRQGDVVVTVDLLCCEQGRLRSRPLQVEIFQQGRVPGWSRRNGTTILRKSEQPVMRE